MFITKMPFLYGLAYHTIFDHNFLKENERKRNKKLVQVENK